MISQEFLKGQTMVFADSLLQLNQLKLNHLLQGSLKFLRDGRPASDVVALYSVDGTPDDWNFFSKDLRNHIEAPTGAALKVLAAKFASYTNLSQEVGLSNFSDYDQYG